MYELRLWRRYFKSVVHESFVGLLSAFKIDRSFSSQKAKKSYLWRKTLEVGRSQSFKGLSIKFSKRGKNLEPNCQIHCSYDVFIILLKVCVYLSCMQFWKILSLGFILYVISSKSWPEIKLSLLSLSWKHYATEFSLKNRIRATYYWFCIV